MANHPKTPKMSRLRKYFYLSLLKKNVIAFPYCNGNVSIIHSMFSYHLTKLIQYHVLLFSYDFQRVIQDFLSCMFILIGSIWRSITTWVMLSSVNQIFNWPRFRRFVYRWRRSSLRLLITEHINLSMVHHILVCFCSCVLKEDTRTFVT